jgi:tRNA threonylcarbamoyladenosine biosynthesis protein TsaB
VAPVLALDTSGSFCSVAVRAVSGVVYHRASLGAGDHFERLPGLVEEVLLLAECRATDLAQVRIGVGPGSFTGLRIGMSFAKGLCAAIQAPLFAVSSFDGVAWGAAVQRGFADGISALVCADARRDEVFAAEYKAQGGEVIRLGEACIKPLSFVGEWRGVNPDGVVLTPLTNFAVAGNAVIEVQQIAQGLLCVESASGQEFAWESLALIEPNYLRAVAARSIAERLQESK